MKLETGEKGWNGVEMLENKKNKRSIAYIYY